MFFEAANQLVTNLQNGLILLVLGMGTVFVFLAVLIFLCHMKNLLLGCLF